MTKYVKTKWYENSLYKLIIKFYLAMVFECVCDLISYFYQFKKKRSKAWKFFILIKADTIHVSYKCIVCREKWQFFVKSIFALFLFIERHDETWYLCAFDDGRASDREKRTGKMGMEKTFNYFFIILVGEKVKSL